MQLRPLLSHPHKGCSTYKLPSLKSVSPSTHRFSSMMQRSLTRYLNTQAEKSMFRENGLIDPFQQSLRETQERYVSPYSRAILGGISQPSQLPQLTLQTEQTKMTRHKKRISTVNMQILKAETNREAIKYFAKKFEDEEKNKRSTTIVHHSRQRSKAESSTDSFKVGTASLAHHNKLLMKRQKNMEKEQLSSDIRKAMFEIITQKENHEVTVIEQEEMLRLSSSLKSEKKLKFEPILHDQPMKKQPLQKAFSRGNLLRDWAQNDILTQVSTGSLQTASNQRIVTQKKSLESASLFRVQCRGKKTNIKVKSSRLLTSGDNQASNGMLKPLTSTMCTLPTLRDNTRNAVRSPPNLLFKQSVTSLSPHQSIIENLTSKLPNSFCQSIQLVLCKQDEQRKDKPRVDPIIVGKSLPVMPSMKRLKRAYNMVADAKAAYSEAFSTSVQSPKTADEVNRQHTSSSYLTSLTGTGSTRKKEVGSVYDSTAENTGTFQQLAKQCTIKTRQYTKNQKISSRADQHSVSSGKNIRQASVLTESNLNSITCRLNPN